MSFWLETGGDRSSQQPERHFTPGAIKDHLIIGSLFALGILYRPGPVIGLLRKEGIKALGPGYQRFYENTKYLVK